MAEVSEEDFLLSSYDYHLPEELVAQYPSPQRGESRLLVLDRASGRTRHHGSFREVVAYFREGDLLVVNDSRVFPARLLGRKETGGRVEVLLLRLPEPGRPVPALFRGRRPRPGLRLRFAPDLAGEIVSVGEGGRVEVRLESRGDLLAVLSRRGRVPLPPYIRRDPVSEDLFRYQTVYARRPGSVAAPTAGLHFTEDLLASLRHRGVTVVSVTLHVGYGTFAPVRAPDVRAHRLHEEFVEISPETAALIRERKRAGAAVFAVGTTTLRALEFAARRTGEVEAVAAWCDLYIYPGFTFRVVDHLITNFHLPRSSLLVLVAAFAGRRRILAAYEEAVKRKYRFFSYGDAMLIL